MTDFLTALQSGIKSAMNREDNFIEIHNTFLRVKEQIDIFSEDRFEVQLQGISKNDPFKKPKDYFKDHSDLYSDKKLIMIDNKRIAKLTEIYFDRNNGYPCTILIDGDEFTSTNLESLEDNLRKLLSSPSTGNVLYSFIKTAP